MNKREVHILHSAYVSATVINMPRHNVFYHGNRAYVMYNVYISAEVFKIFVLFFI